MNGREVSSDLDCADCLCAVCARSAHTSMYNKALTYLDMPCIPCDCCYIGSELIETEEDCPHGFLPDTEDYEREGADDYERAVEQAEHDARYEPTYNFEDGSM